MVDTRIVNSSKQAVAIIKEKKLENIYLSSTQIDKLKLFFWTNSSRQRVKLIKNDVFAGNLLKAEIHGEGPHTRYSILGKNIIKFIEKYGDVLNMLKTPRKQKNAWNKRMEKSQKKYRRK